MQGALVELEHRIDGIDGRSRVTQDWRLLDTQRMLLAMKTICLLILLSVSAGAAELPKEIEQGITHSVESEMSVEGIPGGAGAIVCDGKVVYQRGFGSRSTEEQLTVTPKTLFRLGSTTKMLTSFVALNAAAEGELDLNATIERYVPELNSALGRVTMRQLLSHSAGIREASPSIESKDDDTLRKMVLSWRTDYLFAPPGEVFSYTGPGYWLAGAVLESVAKKPYAELMKERLFIPAKMTRTTLRPLEAVTYEFAQGHELKDGHLIVVRPMAENVAQYSAGSVFSSADELAKLAILILNRGGGVFAPAAVERFFTTEVRIPSSSDVRYGYGMVSFEIKGTRIFEHGGVRRGYGSHIRFLPEKRGAVILMTNKNGETLRKSLAYITKLLWALEEPKPEPKTLALSAGEAQRFVGKYNHADIVTVEVKWDGQQLLVVVEKDKPLKRMSEYTFEDPDGTEYSFVFVNGQERAKYLHFDLLSTMRTE
jgi:CubicO group peptidase (beta-lactamase class C family)